MHGTERLEGLIQLRVAPQDKRRMIAMARARGVSLSRMIRTLVSDGLSDEAA